MKLVQLNTLFDIKYGNSLELINLEQCSNDSPLSVNYVSRTEKTNGISAFVKLKENIPVNPANTISVAVSGSVLSSFLQPKPYYTGFHVFVLVPLKPMSELQLLFYCECIKANKYKYNYGRQANRTLKDILVPETMPLWSKDIVLPKYNDISKAVNEDEMQLGLDEWEWFQINDLFDIKYGVNLELNKMILDPNGIPFVSRTSKNNGVCATVELIEDVLPNPANTISVSGGGSVLECFIQDTPYYSGRDLFYLKPKKTINNNVLFFICTIIKQEKYRFNYGRQANKSLRTMNIQLPAINGSPNFEFMDAYIKSLPYSYSLTKEFKKLKPIEPVKKPHVEKGLSDEDLVKKYESGSIDFGNTLKPILKK